MSAVTKPYELHELPMSVPVTKHANYNHCGIFGLSCECEVLRDCCVLYDGLVNNFREWLVLPRYNVDWLELNTCHVGCPCCINGNWRCDSPIRCEILMGGLPVLLVECIWSSDSPSRCEILMGGLPVILVKMFRPVCIVGLELMSSRSTHLYVTSSLKQCQC